LLAYIVFAVAFVPEKGDLTWISFSGDTPYTQTPTFENVVTCLPYAIWWFVGMEVIFGFVSKLCFPFIY
jgi:hypothetical protein